MSTVRKGPLLVMDRGQALRSLAQDLNSSFAAMYAKFEGGGDELQAPPPGFHYLVNADNAFIVNADGAYILVDGDI